MFLGRNCLVPSLFLVLCAIIGHIKAEFQKICSDDQPPFLLLCNQARQPRIQNIRLAFVSALHSSSGDCEQLIAYNLSEPVNQIQEMCNRASNDYSICLLDTSYVKSLLTRSYPIPQTYNPIPLRFEVTYDCSDTIINNAISYGSSMFSTGVFIILSFFIVNYLD